MNRLPCASTAVRPRDVVTNLAIHPLTEDRWLDFEALFGPAGACRGCWCTEFRLPAKTFKSEPASAKKAFIHDRIMAGPPPGLLGYGDGTAIAWMQIGPRADVPQWNSPRRLSAPVPDAPADDPSVWAITCFFFAKAARRRGVSHEMIRAGIAHARQAGARLIEACPVDPANGAGTVSRYVGSTAAFERAGFSTIAERRPGRPLMRLEL